MATASSLIHVRAVLQRHLTVLASNDTVSVHPDAYADFLDLWLQEGLSRFVVAQKLKTS